MLQTSSDKLPCSAPLRILMWYIIELIKVLVSRFTTSSTSRFVITWGETDIEFALPLFSKEQQKENGQKCKLYQAIKRALKRYFITYITIPYMK